MFHKWKKVTAIAVASLLFFAFGVWGVKTLLHAEKSVNTIRARAETTATTPQIEIISQNVSYADSIYILYAVSNEGFDRNTHEIHMLFWDTPQTNYDVHTAKYERTDEGSATVKGMSCLVFYSEGLAAKEMTTDLYCRAYTEIDGETYYSEVKKYSVLEYVHEKKETSSLKESQALLFDAMLDYGAAAQTYLAYKTDRLANAEYYTLSIVNGALSDGFTFGRYNAQETVCITANAPKDGYVFSHWEDSKGYTVSKEETFTVSIKENSVYTAVYAEKEREPSKGLEYSLNSEGKSYSVTGIGTCTDTEIVIPSTYEGLPVTSIGQSAFKNCSSLTEIVIPNGVTSIGWNAFYWCENLTNVNIPEGIAYIGGNAFNACLNLTEVVLPSSLITIEGCVFSGTKLADIVIPENVEYIGWGAFPNTITNIEVSEKNGYYSSVDGNLYNKNKTTLVQYASSKTETEFIIPDSVTNILPGAFLFCYNLERVVIPNSVTNMEQNTFLKYYSLTIYCEVAEKPNGWSNQWTDCPVVWDCNNNDVVDTSLIYYTLSENGTYYTLTGYGGKETSLVIPSTYKDLPVTSIGDYAFWGCDNLTEIVIPDSVTWIGKKVFNGCSLTNIIVGENNANYSSLDGNLYNKNQTELILYAREKIETSFTIPNSVTSIGESAFSECSNLTEIVIPDSVTSIGFGAFRGCSNLTEIVIPNSVTSIGGWAFTGTGYYNDESNWEDSVLYIGKYLIEAKQDIAGAYTIKDDTVCIAAYAFEGCNALTEIVIPDSVTSIGDWAFEYCTSLTSVIFENAEGWRVQGYAWGEDEEPIVINTQISSDDLRNPSTAATYLTTTYSDYSWICEK